MTAPDEAEREYERDPEGRVLFQHREMLLPIVLRILFSKATKKATQLDKRTSKTTRRTSVFSYLSALTELAAVPELLLVLMEPLLAVLAAPEGAAARCPLLDGPAAGGLVPVTSAVRKAALVRGLFQSRQGEEGSRMADAEDSVWLPTLAVEVEALKGRINNTT